MKIYLDACSLQRPFDDKTQIRILLESEAVLGIITYFENKKIDLINSEVLEYEIARIPNNLRRLNSINVLSAANIYVKLNTVIEKNAKTFSENGIMPLDALHLASAEYAKTDYFCTCDDKLIIRARRVNLKLKIVTPIELIGEIEK
jgi:predicted nucleic acid-binding protein